MEKKGVRSEGRGLRRTLIAVLGTITLTTASSGPLIGQSSSAVPGRWLYLPLSKIGRDVNGFYGYNIASGLCGTHYAEDLTGTQGDPVLAAADGNVLYAGPANDGTGLYFVTLTHTNGYTTKYYHLQHMTSLSKGQYVPRGTKVGEIYSPLGGYSHVHFSVRSGTDNVNGCTLSNTTGGCVDPGDPPGMSKSSSCFGDGADPGSGMWVTNSSGVVVLANLANASTTNATVNVAVSAGAGTVTVTRNGAVVGSTTSSQVFNFNIGDTYAFQASPSSGYSFAEFCGDAACSISTTSNPFSGSITAPSGNVFAYFVTCAPSCAGRNCGADGCGGSCGSCGYAQTCGGSGLCVNVPTCPTGTCQSNATGWCGPGYYCNTSGIVNGASNTLYHCSAAGAPADSARYCSEECHYEYGYNDQCWEDTSTCYNWRSYNVDACGWDYVNGNPRIDYHCYYGSKSIYRWCAPGRCAWGSVNDYCY